MGNVIFEFLGDDTLGGDLHEIPTQRWVAFKAKCDKWEKETFHLWHKLTFEVVF